MKRLAAVLMAVAMLLGITLVSASPASAAYSDCPAGQSCMWTGQSATGVIFTVAFSAYDPVGTCWNLPGLMPGNVESVKAGFGPPYVYGLEFYSNGNCISFHGDVWKVHANSTENWAGPPKKNRAYSFKIINYP